MSNPKELNPTLVFAKFGQIASLQKGLYKDYTAIDENEEIANDWMKFSEIVVDHLLSIIELTKSLYDRIVDELKRSPNKAEVDDLKRLQSITGFWTDLTLLSYAYATMGKTGLFKKYGLGKSTVGYYRTKHFFDQLVTLAFSQQASFTPSNLDVLLKILKQDQLKKELGYFREIEIDSDELGHGISRFNLLAEYDLNQAIFILNDVARSIRVSIESWWWRDSIVMHANMDHAIHHLDQTQNIEEKITSDIKLRVVEANNRFYRPIQLLSNAYLSQHFKTLAKQALMNDDLDSASEYFEKGKLLIEEFSKNNRAMYEPLNGWTENTVIEELEFFKFAHVLVKATKTYLKLLKELENDSIAESEKDIDQIITDIRNVLQEGDVPFLSSMLLVYDTVFSFTKEWIGLNTEDKTKSPIPFIQDRLKLLEKRLNQSFYQTSTDWMAAVQSPSENFHEMKHINKNSELISLAILLLPDSKIFKKESLIQLFAIEEASEALKIGSLAEAEFGKNPVKELMIRAKTYYLIMDAIEYSKSQGSKDLASVIDKFLSPLGDNALLRGLIAEIQLRTSLLQYAFINKIAVIIDASLLGTKPIPQGLNIPQDLSEIHEFKKSMKELLVAIETLINNRKPIRIKGSLVNWEYFKTLYGNISGAILFTDAITAVIKASNLMHQKKFGEATSEWYNAKTSTFAAAEKIAKSGSSESKALAEQIYTIAQMFGEMEERARNNKRLDQTFPEEILIETLQALVMT